MGLLEIARDFAVANWDNAIMWVIGGILIYLAIKKDMEPTLLLPMGFGAIIVNLPGSAIAADGGIIRILYDCGIANEFFPLVLFIGIGAMIDFGPVLTNPKLMLFGAAAQFGIFFTLCMATLCGFGPMESASIAIIGAADGQALLLQTTSASAQTTRGFSVRSLLRHIPIWLLFRLYSDQ